MSDRTLVGWTVPDHIQWVAFGRHVNTSCLVDACKLGNNAGRFLVPALGAAGELIAWLKDHAHGGQVVEAERAKAVTPPPSVGVSGEISVSAGKDTEEGEKNGRGELSGAKVSLLKLIQDGNPHHRLTETESVALAEAILAAGWQAPPCNCLPFDVCERCYGPEQQRESQARQLAYCEEMVPVADPEDADQCPNLRERGSTFCAQHQPAPVVAETPVQAAQRAASWWETAKTLNRWGNLHREAHRKGLIEIDNLAAVRDELARQRDDHRARAEALRAEIRAVLDNVGFYPSDHAAFEEIRALVEREPSAPLPGEDSAASVVHRLSVMFGATNREHMGGYLGLVEVAIREGREWPVLEPKPAPDSETERRPRVFFPGDVMPEHTLTINKRGFWSLSSLSATTEQIRVEVPVPAPEEWQSIVDRARAEREANRG